MKEDAVVTMFELDSVLNFGKHRGKTVREVMNTSPGYIVWAYNNVDWFGVPANIYKDACILDGSPCNDRQLKKGVPPKEDTPLFDANETAQKDQQKLFDDIDDVMSKPF